MECFIVFPLINVNILSSHMDQISQHINYSNHKIHSYYQIRMIIVNLSIKKGDKNYDSHPKLIHTQNTLLIRIVGTTE